MAVLNVPSASTMGESDNVCFTQEELAKAVAKDSREWAAGVVIGLVLIVFGVFLLLTGLGGTAGAIELTLPGGYEFSIGASPAGIILVIIGAALVYISRPTVAAA